MSNNPEAQTVASDRDTQRGSDSRTWRGILKETLIVIVGALVISTLLRLFVMQLFVIPSDSMNNTLINKDRVVVLKFGGYERGDIIVFRDSSNWLSKPQSDPEWWQKGLEFIGLLPDSSHQHLIKRLIGMPGDTVECCDTQGRITINGHAMDESDYLYSDASGPVAPSDWPFKVVVPKDRYFVMGDHRNGSSDSRCKFARLGIDGFVRKEDVVGPAVALAFPLNRARRFGPPAVYADVPAGQEPSDTPVIEADDVHCQ